MTRSIPLVERIRALLQDATAEHPHYGPVRLSVWGWRDGDRNTVQAMLLSGEHRAGDELLRWLDVPDDGAEAVAAEAREWAAGQPLTRGLGPLTVSLAVTEEEARAIVAEAVRRTGAEPPVHRRERAVIQELARPATLPAPSPPALRIETEALLAALEGLDSAEAHEYMLRQLIKLDGPQRARLERAVRLLLRELVDLEFGPLRGLVRPGGARE